jgi:hypothetical protein
LKELCYGLYATHIYLPLSGLARRWRRFSRHMRGIPSGSAQSTRLYEVSWRQCTTRRFVRVWEAPQENGNVRISELGVLAALAADCEDRSSVLEIGTFDGRTTLNLALNAPPHCRIYTLDLPPGTKTRFALESGERHMVDKPAPGLRYEKYRAVHSAAVGRIHQLLGDSAVFDFSPYEGSCSLVFVDGSHSYDYVVSDSRAAMRMAKPGGSVLWHDYGVWGGVTRALEELDRREGWGLRKISGTSLVWWLRPRAGKRS